MLISRRAVCSALPFLLFLAAAFFSMSGVAEAHHRCGHKGSCAPPPAPAPTASYTYSPAAPAVGQAVSFDGRGSSCQATPCTYRWEDGATAIGTGTTLTHSFSTAGTHQLKLTVTDAQSRSASVTKTITVSEPASAPSGDLAVNKTATASSIEGTTYAASFANDGDSSTRWSSAFTDNQWWRVDLGNSQSINQVIINWTTSYGTSYRIEGSTDGSTWSTLWSGGATGIGILRHDFAPASVRYVKFVGLTRSRVYGFSFWDFEVRNTGSTTAPAPAPTASYSYSPAAPTVGQAVSFDGRGSSCEATPCTYRWEDGATVIGTGTTLTHSFSTAASHQLKLTVTDAQSRSNSVTKAITVSEPATSLLSETFTGPDGVFASSSAFWDNSDMGVSENPNWFAEGGTMYRRSGTGRTTSSVFRMWTRRTDLAFTKIEMDIRFNGWTGGTASWNGINLWLNRKLRSNSDGSRINDGPQQEGYVVDFLNRDGSLLIMKKVGDTYYTLSRKTWAPQQGRWYRWGGRVIDNGNGTSTIQVLADGLVILQATDNGSTGGPRLLRHDRGQPRDHPRLTNIAGRAPRPGPGARLSDQSISRLDPDGQ